MITKQKLKNRLEDLEVMPKLTEYASKDCCKGVTMKGKRCLNKSVFLGHCIIHHNKRFKDENNI